MDLGQEVRRMFPSVTDLRRISWNPRRLAYVCTVFDSDVIGGYGKATTVHDKPPAKKRIKTGDRDRDRDRQRGRGEQKGNRLPRAIAIGLSRGITEVPRISGRRSPKTGSRTCTSDMAWSLRLPEPGKTSRCDRSSCRPATTRTSTRGR